jgi:hypothetical protein
MTTELSNEVLTPDEVTALLRGAGAIEDNSTGYGFQRVKVSGSTFTIGDEIFVSNPKTKKPAFIAQIVELPKQYQARYFDEEKAGDMELLSMMIDPITGKDRSHLAGTFCKSYFDEPDQAREKNEKGDSCRSCVVSPFVRKTNVPEAAGGKKCQWRGELLLRVLDSEMKAVSEDVVMLDLSSTAMQEWQGFASEPVKGYVSELNFMQKLAQLAQTKYPDNPKVGIFKALTALKLGGVLAEVRAIPTSSHGKDFSVVSLTPIEILDEVAEGAPAIATSADPAPADADDIPF